MLVSPPLWMLMVNIIVGKHVFVIFLSLYITRSFRGTCSSINMRKGYMARVSLGTPALDGSFTSLASQSNTLGWT